MGGEQSTSRARARNRRVFRLKALFTVAVIAAISAGLVIAGITLVDSSENVPSRAASAKVLSVSGCHLRGCNYSVIYIAEGTIEQVTIGAGTNEPGAGSTTTIYYQVAHPDVARFPGSNYPPSVLGIVLAVLGVLPAGLVLMAVLRALIRRDARGASRRLTHRRPS